MKWVPLILLIEAIRKGYLFCPKWNIKGLRIRPRSGASLFKILLSTFGGLSYFLFWIMEYSGFWNIRAVLLRYWRKKLICTVLHKIYNFSGKITLLNFFKNNYLEICLVYFFCAEYYGFPETEIFFFWKFNFCPFQWGIAWYGTVNNSRDIIF